ncbi:DNA-binding transcriptional LysR family regulator [Kribbella antiqua]|uniref:DNA-binding transcriptional LysR family regulator n=1 Tax=Kribbella antiqua TaxID=2512217 RepID=A0A4R2IQ72_9ACTN|nr:LysR family transcriptional regulator [Kribbella antiqua]TCO47037.1 DNA-binding transcriptional LysR family regulator [Kribbella antiqua]
MDPHLLRTFVAVAECGSFSAAADRLGYTQSAVSQHIAALEHDLGTTLLRRRPVAPTPPGERLLDHAGAILLRLDAARADVHRAIGEPPGTLTIAASPLAAGGGRLAEALTAVRRNSPGTAVSLTVDGREAVTHGVAAGEFQLGLIDGVAAPTDPLRLSDLGSLRTTAVAHEDLVVALSTNHPLARRRRVDLHDLVDARWIDAPDTAAALPDLRAATETDGIRAAFNYAGTDLRALLALIAAGHGLAVLPASAATSVSGIAVVPLGAPRLVHRTELLHGHLDGSRAAELVTALTAPANRRTD